MLRLTDPSTGRVSTVVAAPGQLLTVAAGATDLGTLLATDTFRRTAQVLGSLVRVVGVPAGWEALNVPASEGSGPADVVVVRPSELAGPPYGLEHRLAWLSGDSPDAARDELAQWRALVAGWAEKPSKPMCAEVQQEMLAALADDLATVRAVEVLRGSLFLDLPPGCLFETWAWADRLLALDLAADVGR